uniref:Uncharacterized protein n=1 Tax=Nelumbo nucifera TaxID=4432 RepID=A0A822XHI5_NELNU|nr:TPA_asm: hypothetical protein HUJ06_021160 [Nelumbo nucifera]
MLQPTTAAGNPLHSHRQEPMPSHTHTWPTVGNPCLPPLIIYKNKIYIMHIY